MPSLISKNLLAAKNYVSFASIKSENKILLLPNMAAYIYSDLVRRDKMAKMVKMYSDTMKNASPLNGCTEYIYVYFMALGPSTGKETLTSSQHIH
jgi:hypothetical protein